MASQASKPKDREERTELDFFFQIMTTVKGKKEDICLSKTHTHTHKVFFFFFFLPNTIVMGKNISVLNKRQ